MRTEVYTNGALTTITEVFRSGTEIRYREESPPGTEITNRLATVNEQQTFFDQEAQERLDRARSNLRSLDISQLPMPDVIHDILRVIGERDD